MNSLGYTTTCKILNAIDYGTPQNRKRLFTVSVLGDKEFIFPSPHHTNRRLKDLLENNVSESYYLSLERIKTFESHRLRQESKGTGFGYNPQNINDIDVSYCITTRPDRYVSTWLIEQGNIDAYRLVHYPTVTKKGYTCAFAGDGLVMNRLVTARGTVQEQKSPTLTTGNGCGTGTVTEDLRIRYLTERECFRLMDVPEIAIDKIFDAIPTKTARYHLAGNSIVVGCLVAIFDSLLINPKYVKKKPIESFEMIE